MLFLRFIQMKVIITLIDAKKLQIALYYIIVHLPNTNLQIDAKVISLLEFELMNIFSYFHVTKARNCHSTTFDIKFSIPQYTYTIQTKLQIDLEVFYLLEFEITRVCIIRYTRAKNVWGE